MGTDQALEHVQHPSFAATVGAEFALASLRALFASVPVAATVRQSGAKVCRPCRTD